MSIADIVNALPGVGEHDPLEAGLVRIALAMGLRTAFFEGFDAQRNLVRKVATIDDLRKKIILMQPYDRALYLSSLQEKGVPGYLYLFAHAGPSSVQGLTSGIALADVIRRCKIWKGEPLMIDACNAGAIPTGITQQLAIALRATVTAASTTTWNYMGGGGAIGRGAYEKLPPNFPQNFPDLRKPGTWRTWGPDGTLISDLPTSPRDRNVPVPTDDELRQVD